MTMPAQYFCPECDKELDLDIEEPIDITLGGREFYMCSECDFEGTLDEFSTGEREED